MLFCGYILILVCLLAASGSLSGKKKVKKMQGVAAGKSRADGAAGGAIKLAEELDAG
jgi:hypothetical protein